MMATHYPQNLSPENNQGLHYSGFAPIYCTPALKIQVLTRRLRPKTGANRLSRAKPDVLQSWSALVPEDFRFVLKAPRRITHIKRLKEAEEEVRYFLNTVNVLTHRLGCVLYQLPPFLRKDMSRLQAFVELLPKTPNTAFEFRHSSWSDSEVLELLEERDFAFCVSDSGSQTEIPELAHGSWGYLRLRQDHYTQDGLKSWAKSVREQPWETAYIFFKHEADGPRLARQFLDLAEHC